MTDPYYLSADWRALREYILERDNYTCVIQGCNEPAVLVDHIVSRRNGGDEEPRNLRSLCRVHDNQMKERDKRGIGYGRVGVATSPCDVHGMPLDVNHPWHKQGR